MPHAVGAGSFAALPATATPSPSTSATTQAQTPPKELVTPGVPGFLALFFLAAAVIVLGTSMVRRVRRVNYEGRLREEQRRDEEPPAPDSTP
ncbi:hypothetical protein [Kineococcus xinjiangensis]|nr:hypothetical protein [Kineococcus xinjiangensis]